MDDPRNTDNAWMETIAYNFHDENDTVFKNIVNRVTTLLNGIVSPDNFEGFQVHWSTCKYFGRRVQTGLDHSNYKNSSNILFSHLLLDLMEFK